MKVFFNSLYYLLIGAVLAIGLLLLATLTPLLGSYKIKVVKSGSMEPAIKTGGIVVIGPASPYKVGDVITFGEDTETQVPTTHRIVEINGRGPLQTFTTKGDANDAPDPAPTRIPDIHGKMLFTVPYVGYILDFARKPIGFIFLVGVPAVLIIFDEIGKIVREVKKIRRKKSNDENNYRETT